MRDNGASSLGKAASAGVEKSLLCARISRKFQPSRLAARSARISRRPQSSRGNSSPLTLCYGQPYDVMMEVVNHGEPPEFKEYD